jgi:hypothetical protein
VKQAVLEAKRKMNRMAKESPEDLTDDQYEWHWKLFEQQCKASNNTVKLLSFQRSMSNISAGINKQRLARVYDRKEWDKIEMYLTIIKPEAAFYTFYKKRVDFYQKLLKMM